MTARLSPDPPIASAASWPARRSPCIVAKPIDCPRERMALVMDGIHAVESTMRRPVRPTTDHDPGSPGDPQPGESLAEWGARARAGGYRQYPQALIRRDDDDSPAERIVLDALRALQATPFGYRPYAEQLTDAIAKAYLDTAPDAPARMRRIRALLRISGESA
jgi:hypothetical protein